MRQNVLFDRWITWVYVMALMIGRIWHGLDALQGTRAKPGNHLVLYKPASVKYLLSICVSVGLRKLFVKIVSHNLLILIFYSAIYL